MLWQHTVNYLATHPVSAAECSYANTEAKQLLISWAWQIPAREWDSCRLCHHSFLAQFLRSPRAICSTDRTYKLPGSHVWAVLSSEKSRSPATAIKVSKSRHNSRTNLRTKVLSMQIRANIDISLYCLFQRLLFSERREMLVTDGRTDGQTATTTVCLGSSALGITRHQRCWCLGRISASCNLITLSDNTAAYTRAGIGSSQAVLLINHAISWVCIAFWTAGTASSEYRVVP